MPNRNCPKCSGKLYIDTIDSNEACCINCGHIEYLDGIRKETQLEVTEGDHKYLDPLRNSQKVKPVQVRIDIDVAKLLHTRRRH